MRLGGLVLDTVDSIMRYAHPAPEYKRQVIEAFFRLTINTNREEIMSKEGVHKCNTSENCHEENHICRIIIRKDLGRIKELVKDAQFYCKNCGRAAHNSENLCNPSKI